MNHKKLIVFDLDDTLVDTSHVYWFARTRFVEIMSAAGFSAESVIRNFELVDESHIETYGYVPERYERSMLTTYRKFLQEIRKSPDSTIEKEISDCGKLITTTIPEVIDGALELLKWAQDKFILAVLTRGIPALQNAKLDKTNLGSFFVRREIAPIKTADTYTQLVESLGIHPRETWVIGDSIKSDINPAIEIGATAILYRYQHHSYLWQQEYGSIAKGPFFLIDRLIDAIPILRTPDFTRQVTAL